MSKLLIVESPSKIKPIKKYLDSDYEVMASVGHIRDLPKSKLGVDLNNNFEPQYINMTDKKDVIKSLKQAASEADQVYLATDPDREGEAISWHLAQILALDMNDANRVTFNEITKSAVQAGIKVPRQINMDLVDAQQARRVLDRIVGYQLSPFLWKKVKSGLSAGRVQTVALRLIVEREREIEKFVSQEFWSVDAKFAVGRKTFSAHLYGDNNGKIDLIPDEKSANEILANLENAEYTVSEVKKGKRNRQPAPPFITSTLQQEASTKLNFSSKKTMQIAQKLYEGVNIGSKRVGLITYMRTDSVRISDSALEDVRSWIGKNFPNDLPEKPVEYAVGKKAQDAHEAIRPTYTEYTPDYVKEFLSRDELRLYQLIWEAFVSSQMKGAKCLTTSVDIKADEALFRVSSTKVTEKGFYNVVKLLSSKEEITGSIPSLKIGEELKATDFSPEQHFTSGPARYTDASIVKTLEEKGIGRPSTYAPIISVLLDRYYISRNNKQFVPTPLGKMINDILVDSFPDVINENFTAEIESKLDEVEEGKVEWPKMMGDFFFPFKNHVDEVMSTLESVKGSMDEVTDKTCELCGKPMLKKLGRFGYFLACSGFPECHNTKSIPLAKCPRPECNGEIVERKNKGKSKSFYGCTNYPTCDFISHFKPIDQYCPKCGWFMVEKYDKKHGSFKSCINPDCTYLHTAGEEVEN